jgi:hypothetical protein
MHALNGNIILTVGAKKEDGINSIPYALTEELFDFDHTWDIPTTNPEAELNRHHQGTC